MSDPGRLSFHVPAPAVRPGGTPDFSDVKIPPAGEVRRPEVDVAPEDIRDLAYSIIRVLNRNGEAVGPWAGLLGNEELLEGLRHLVGGEHTVLEEDLAEPLGCGVPAAPGARRRRGARGGGR